MWSDMALAFATRLGSTRASSRKVSSMVHGSSRDRFAQKRARRKSRGKHRQNNKARNIFAEQHGSSRIVPSKEKKNRRSTWKSLQDAAVRITRWDRG